MDWTISRRREESPSKTWSRFFPSVELSQQDTFAYPQPYTVQFCQLYGERLIDFCDAAKLLVAAILQLGRKQPKISGDVKLPRHQALDTINLLRRPIDSVLDFAENGSVKPSRVAPSLLASFADMFAQDLVYGRPRHCQLGREGVVLVRNGRLSWSRLRPLSLSARPRRIAIARVGDSSISANGVLLGKDSGRHHGGRETVGLGQQI